MAFRFRLQSVLKLRESEKTSRQSELAEALQADQILLEQRQKQEEQLQAIEVEIRDSIVNHVDVDFLLSLRRYQTDTRQTIRQIQTQREQVAQEIERRQARLANANQQVKIMETVRDQQKVQFDNRLAKIEQDALDEFRVKRT